MISTGPAPSTGGAVDPSGGGGAAARPRLPFPIMDRRRTVATARRLALDWVAPVAILVIGIVNVARSPHSTSYPGAPSEHLIFLAVAAGGLGLRRHAPLLAPLGSIAVVLWWSSVMWPVDAQGPFEGFLVLVGAAYSIGALNTGRRLWFAAGALAATFVVGQVVLLGGGGRDGDLLPVAVWQLVALALGHLFNRRTEQAHTARAQARSLAADQERRTAQAIEDERARIARELHDVVAHSLSVIVVQAGAERRALHNRTGADRIDADPIDAASVDAALAAIERTGRDALVDLRRLLGLLRRTAEPAALAPQPGLGQLDELVRSIRDAGLQVDLELTGDRAPLPPGLDLTAYRIVQEALTNVLKHSAARRVQVRVAFRRNQLEIEVVDDGRGGRHESVPALSSGHGLIGMRERVSVFGGTVSAGPGTGGGWAVHSVLPVAGG
jgi:signal transduction histidine kinase